MDLIYLTLIFVLFAAFHRIITLPGELLAPFNKWVNFESNFHPIIKKLLTCTKCIAFWASLFSIIFLELFQWGCVVPPLVFVFSYFIEKAIV